MTLVTYPFHYQHIRNFYSEEELFLIWEEIDRYHADGNKFLYAEDTGSAISGGKILKGNRGVWLYDELISNWDIEKITKKLNTPKILSHPSSWFFKDVQFNCDSLLLSYYDDGDYYLRHNDCSYVTACIWLYKEPKKFLGGEFHFPDYDIKIKCENNSCVIFPSNIYHSVSKVYLPEEYKNKGLGRYCISKFIMVGPDHNIF